MFNCLHFELDSKCANSKFALVIHKLFSISNSDGKINSNDNKEKKWLLLFFLGLIGVEKKRE